METFLGRSTTTPLDCACLMVNVHLLSNLERVGSELTRCSCKEVLHV